MHSLLISPCPPIGRKFVAEANLAIDEVSCIRKMTAMDDFLNENLCHDPIHGYIRFVASASGAESDFCERNIIDHPWVQRMRQIRQLQTAWWVFPTAEHSRFQHVLGVSHVASRAIDQLYDSLLSVDPATPSKPFVDSMMRLAALLHDVGHGPFGHFFDEHFLQKFGLTHETLGALIIEKELGNEIGQIQESPIGEILPTEKLVPADIAWLIQRPVSSPAKGGPQDLADEQRPKWQRLLKSLFCGIYTVDNMDFVLRDAYMTGLSPRAFELDRIIHYSSFTEYGLTIHDRGMNALIHFLSMKAELFRSVYFHRTVRALDLELAELFRLSFDYLFPGDPREHLDAYLELTEFSLLTDVRRWKRSSDVRLRKIGHRWDQWLQRKVPWIMVCQRSISFSEGQREAASVFSSSRVFRESVKEQLPAEMKNVPFEVDLARHIHRPNTRGATAGLNYFYDSAAKDIRPLTMHGLYERLPVSHTIARIYAHSLEHQGVFTDILDGFLGTASRDDLTNM